MSHVWISHLGSALPGPAISQDEAVRWLEPRLHPKADRSRFLRMAAKSGVAVRHSVLDIHGADGASCFPLSGGASADMLERSRLFAARSVPLALAAVHDACPDGVGAITHVIATTCTGAVAPGLDIRLAQALGLPSTVRRTMIAFMGCHAAIPALRHAWYACRADPSARVLVVNCELGTLHLRPGPEDDALLAALLFADGATAAVVESADQPVGRGLRIVNDASALIPASDEQMTWEAGSHGFRLTLSPAITSTIAGDLAGIAQQLIGPGRRPDEMRWSVHPGGPRILESARLRLGLAADAVDASRAELAQGGNRSSATILAIVARQTREVWQGPLALVAFGPGLTADGLLLERA
jgi:predicted naringenin-chalcone synthase